MANKEEIKNNVNDIKSEEIPVAEPAAEEAVMTDDTFGEVNVFEGLGERTGENNGTETIFAKLPMKVQQVESPGADGKLYRSYGIGFSTKMRGVDLKQKMFVVPPHHDRTMYDTLAAIFGEEKAIPLDIIRREMTRDNVKTVSYQMRVSAKDDYGSDICCNLNPSGRGDTVIFNNLIAVLKSRGLIT